MKKLRFSIIALIVIAALIFISARAMGLYFSPEKVLEAREAALHYGPSDEILYKYTGPNGRGIIIAKCGDEGLSVIKTERIAGFLFRADGSSDGGVQGYCPCQKQISVWYDSDLDLVYGLSYGEPGEELIVKIGAWNGGQYSDTITSDSDGQYHTSVGEWVEELYSQEVATDEKGFFCINDISESLLKDQSDSRDEYYIYAESVLPVEDTDIRFNSNMPRGLVVGRSELDKLIPYDDEFMSEEDVYDYCVLEFPFALWQWGTPVSSIPELTSDEDDEVWFDCLMKVSSPDYFAYPSQYMPFDVQAAKELGYYGYSLKPIKKWTSLKSTKGYLKKMWLPDSLRKYDFDPALYKRTVKYLKKEDPKHIFIYGEIDPWSSSGVCTWLNCKKKKNMRVYVQPRGSHKARINNMPERMKTEIINRLTNWLN